jgi:uracil-DNA glycosylase
LVRIYKALIADPEIDFKGPGHGCLVEWAQQGVLMLNTALTVRQGEPNSHSGWWERWSDRLITLISQRAPQSIIFMLWGNHARKRARLIGSRHLILEYHHPSPLSQKDWSECRHFSQANKWLISQHQRPINWSLTPIT